MPTFQQAEQLRAFAEEVFALSKEVWAQQNRGGREPTEITETEFLTLDILSRATETPTVGDIQRQLGVLPAQMSRIIRSLEAKPDGPLVRCEINKSDKRKIDVSLTDEGVRVYQAYRQMKLASTQQLLMGLSDQDRQEFMRILRLIREMLHKSSS